MDKMNLGRFAILKRVRHIAWAFFWIYCYQCKMALVARSGFLFLHWLTHQLQSYLEEAELASEPHALLKSRLD